MSEIGLPFDDSLLSFAEGDPRILSVYLLGSAISGRLRPDSDIDLAILAMPGQELGPEERAELGATLAFEIGRDVDIGELSSRNLVYAREALFTGTRIFVRDPALAGVLESCLLGMYARFNEDRWEILDAYRA
jgi:predicted nucleotidyltransferase